MRFARPIRDLGHVAGLPQAAIFMGILHSPMCPKQDCQYFTSVSGGYLCVACRLQLSPPSPQLRSRKSRRRLARQMWRYHRQWLITFRRWWLRDQSRSRLHRAWARSMHESIQPIGPPCEKCEQPMIFHSVQDVDTRHGQQRMQVFECEHCDRLAAFADLVTAQASGKP